MTVSRSSSRSMVATVCRSGGRMAYAYLLLLANHHVAVTNACSCLYVDTPCAAMQERSVLVRATILNVTEFYHEGWPTSTTAGG
eukprot:scaffold49045_cov51-Attheya_sp.AAC.1